MPDGQLPKKSDYRLIILVALILLDAFTFIVFDIFTGGSTSARSLSTLGDAGWLLNAGHIVDLLSGRYSPDFILAGLGAFYAANAYIINKVATILISGVVAIAIYLYAPDLLFICYGYLLGVAGVGIYDGLLNMGVISSEGISSLPFDYKIIPQAIMTICVVTGGIISFSKVAAYIFSRVVALQLFDDNNNLQGPRLPILGRLLNRTMAPGAPEDHRLLIPQESLPIYEKNIRELADLDMQNSIEAIQRSYDLVNQMAEQYGVDQYHIMYDVYKEKQGRSFRSDKVSTAYDSAIDKGM